MSNQAGVLFIVATPIGNLEDITLRAQRILADVDLIAAEDTRHSGRLMDHLGIRTPLTAFHEHNEREKSDELLALLAEGRQVALVSDAGTPLVSDPGYRLVRSAHAAGIRVVPVPGACAAIAALSVSGLPSDRFTFEGFPPARETARRSWLERVTSETRTLIFYESPHRIADSLADMASILGGEREAVYARELTKQFETVRFATLAELSRWVAAHDNQQRGEIVVLVRGREENRSPESGIRAEETRILRILMSELPLRQAATLAAAICQRRKNELYELALRIRDSAPDEEL